MNETPAIKFQQTHTRRRRAWTVQNTYKVLVDGRLVGYVEKIKGTSAPSWTARTPAGSFVRNSDTRANAAEALRRCDGDRWGDLAAESDLHGHEVAKRLDGEGK